MRGHVDPQSGLFSYFSVEERIPADHPLRRVKAQANAVLGSMSPQFDAMYAAVGRDSVAPERLLKATLLIALYSVRSDRLFCEMLDYNMLFFAGSWTWGWRKRRLITRPTPRTGRG